MRMGFLFPLLFGSLTEVYVCPAIEASAVETVLLVNPLLQHRLLQVELTSPYYYDKLRNEIDSSANNETFVTVITDANSSIYQVTLNPNDEANKITYRLAELKSVIAFSNDEQQLIGAQNEAYAVLLAMYHFNNMIALNNHPVLGDQLFNDPSLSSCNIKLTIELLDSTYSPTTATQTIASVLERKSSIAVPMTTAVVSSSPTAITLPIAIFTGIYNVPFISSTATSTGFDDKEQFPMFGRTVTNADGVATISLQYFQDVIQSSHVAILFVTVRTTNRIIYPFALI
jgi:Receptor family ligand binding region